MKKIIWLMLFMLMASSAEAWNFRVGEDWTQSDKDFSTTGTLASGNQTVTGNSTISGTLSVAGSDFSNAITGSLNGAYVNTDYASLSAAITVIGSVTESTLRVCDQEIIADGTTVTVTDNITLDFTCGGDVIGIAGGGTETLIVNGQVVTALGSVPFGTNLTVTDNIVGGGYVISADSVATLRLYDYGTDANNTIWGVKAKGLYYWDETDSTADDGDDFIVPTGSATNGRWLKMALTVPAASGFVGDLTGDVTGNVTGDITGDVTGGGTLTSIVLNTAATGTAIIDDDTMTAVTDTTLVTGESVKAYVDNSLSGVTILGVVGSVTASQVIPTGTATDMIWVGQYYETIEMIDEGGANPERITMPAGVSYVEIHAALFQVTPSVTGTAHYMIVEKNGVVATPSCGDSEEANAVVSRMGCSMILAVSPADYITVQAQHDVGGNSNFQAYVSVKVW